SSAGRGQGGVLLILRLDAERGAGDVPSALTAAGLTAVADLTGVIAVHVLEATPEVTSIATEEKRLPGPGDPGRGPIPQRGVLVEADDAAVLGEVRTGSLAPGRLRVGGVEVRAAEAYRLQIGIDPERGDPKWR